MNVPGDMVSCGETKFDNSILCGRKEFSIYMLYILGVLVVIFSGNKKYKTFHYSEFPCGYY